jgi:hypothetical protein
MALRVERILDSDLYPASALADARKAFAGLCDLRFAPLDGARATAIVEVPADDLAEAREIALSCLNYALDRAIQLLLERT